MVIHITYLLAGATESKLNPIAPDEAVGEISLDDMGKPFNAMSVRVHFYAKVPEIGTKIYLHPAPKQEPLTDELRNFLNGSGPHEGWLLASTQDLAKGIAKRCYPDVPQFQVLGDLAGVISQIDNMTTGMERKAGAAPSEVISVEASLRFQLDSAKAQIADLEDDMRRLRAQPMPACAAQPAREPSKRPVNCGTTHCSCIECVEEPESEPAGIQPINQMVRELGSTCL